MVERREDPVGGDCEAVTIAPAHLRHAALLAADPIRALETCSTMRWRRL
jgi:hypothetical protein